VAFLAWKQPHVGHWFVVFTTFVAFAFGCGATNPSAGWFRLNPVARLDEEADVCLTSLVLMTNSFFVPRKYSCTWWIRIARFVSFS